MIGVEEAIGRLLQGALVQNKVIKVNIRKARGHVLAHDIFSPVSVPHFPKSAMDGYAVYSGDTKGASREKPLDLKVIGEICAGEDKCYNYIQGSAVRVMTGALVPDGYDAVIKQEDTNFGEQIVSVYKELAAYENYCPPGEDIRAGQSVIRKGTRLSCDHIGILASMGIGEVEVLKSVRVGIISTGDELAVPGSPLGGVQVYSSSSYNIAAYLETAGVEVSFLQICPDQVSVFCQMVEEHSSEFDILITTGAVSVGKRDIIPDSMKVLGVQEIFRRVNMKPGTPVIAGKYGEKTVLCLSGNPFAALVNFHVFFWPLLARIMGCDEFCWKRKQIPVRGGSMKAGALRRFLRAYMGEDGVYLYTRIHHSSVFSNVAEANCIIDQPAGEEIREGDLVTILCFPT